MPFLVLCLIAMLCPATVWAGAWPREKGATFLSFSTTINAPLDQLDQLSRDPTLYGLYNSVFLERGVGRDLTLGLDAGMDETTDYTAVFFLRRPIDVGGPRNVFAVQAGVGVALSSGVQDYVFQVGSSWGRGIETRFGHGWISLETKADYRLNLSDLAATADLTLGLKPTKKTKLMFQIQTGRYSGSDPFVRLAPSVARQIGQGRHIELGAQIGVSGDDRVGMKLGTWLEF